MRPAGRASAAVVDGDGRTPLHAACERGKAECAQILIDAGADVFDADKSGTIEAKELQAALPAHLSQMRDMVGDFCRAAQRGVGREAARVDGASEFKLYWNVLFPQLLSLIHI